VRWRALIAVAGLCSTLTAGVAGAAPAGASPLDDARAKAAALAQQVHSLEDQVEAASEAYAAVTAQLGAAVNRHLDAERELDDAQLQLQRSQSA
jgi:chromosome segregation ATPase